MAAGQRGQAPSQRPSERKKHHRKKARRPEAQRKGSQMKEGPRRRPKEVSRKGILQQEARTQ
eukprot:5964384-Heterocapsa_arctica.AAC.1